MDHPDIERAISYGYPTGNRAGGRSYLNREAMRQKKAQEEMIKYREGMKKHDDNQSKSK